MPPPASLDVWGEGQLLAFSAFDGPTDYTHGLVLRSRADAAAFDIKLPAAGGCLVLDLDPPTASFLAGDHFRLATSRGVARGVLADAYHLLVDGPCHVLGVGDALRVLRAPDGHRTLLGVRAHFDPAWLDADIDALGRARAAWWTAAPRPDGLPPPARRTFDKALSQLKTQLSSPEGGIRHRWTTPDRWPHRDLWLWDSVFHAAGLRHIDPAAARESLEAVFDGQRGDGFIPHRAAPGERSTITQPPVLAFGMRLVLDVEDDPAWLARLYPANAAYLRWVLAHRDRDGGGLLEWDIEEHPDCRSGESGMDNSPRFDAATVLDAPDLNAYVAHDCGLMADFALRLGYDADVRFWRGERDRLNRLLNERCWDDDAGLYLDFDPATGKRTGVRASAGFLPLLSGAPDSARVRRMAALLRDPRAFGTAFPVPSVAADGVAPYRKDMWRGPTWININWLIAHGLDNAGRPADAETLRRRTREEIEAHYLRHGTFFEFYDDRGEVPPPALLRKARLDPDLSPYHQVLMDYGWSATLYIDLCFEAFGARACPRVLHEAMAASAP